MWQLGTNTQLLRPTFKTKLFEIRTFQKKLLKIVNKSHFLRFQLAKQIGRKKIHRTTNWK
jgi:CRISPR/Cas system CSM-associated protein Csm2 small subunit